MLLFTIITGAIAALAALLYILEFFGFKPKERLWGLQMPLSRNWKLFILLALVILSLSMSGYGFYRALRPKIVEKTVEKVVSAECPNPQTLTKPKVIAKSPSSGAKRPARPIGSVTQGPGSAFSQNQSGGITAGTVNVGPPPANLTYQEELVSSPPESGEGLQVMKVRITTDRPIPGAIIGILFSGPIEPVTNGEDAPMMEGSPTVQLNWGALQRKSDHANIPNSLSVTINAPAVFTPSEKLIVTIKSKTAIHVTQVGVLGS